mgnify:CR=1 FL=1
MDSCYYDGTKLLSLPDINGNKPEIVVCCSNRSAGKTTYFNRYLVKRFINTGEKFGILFRYKNELQDCANKFFNEIGKLFFPDYTMTARTAASGYLAELFLQHKQETPIPCGYCFALNSADKLKKFSHLLADIEQYIFDEFQTETNHCCNKLVYIQRQKENKEQDQQLNHNRCATHNSQIDSANAIDQFQFSRIITHRHVQSAHQDHQTAAEPRQILEYPGEQGVQQTQKGGGDGGDAQHGA